MTRVNDDFILWLDNELKRHGWSQRELGRRAGISQTTVSLVIAGLRLPTPDFCLVIARAFEMPGDDVLRRAGHLPAPTSPEDLAPEVRFRLEEVARKLTLLEPQERERLTRQYLTLLDFVLSVKGLEEPEEAASEAR